MTRRITVVVFSLLVMSLGLMRFVDAPTQAQDDDTYTPVDQVSQTQVIPQTVNGFTIYIVRTAPGATCTVSAVSVSTGNTLQELRVTVPSGVYSYTPNLAFSANAQIFCELNGAFSPAFTFSVPGPLEPTAPAPSNTPTQAQITPATPTVTQTPTPIPTLPPGICYVRVTVGTLNVRDFPSLNGSTVVGRLSQNVLYVVDGFTVNTDERDATWHRVQFNGVFRWIALWATGISYEFVSADNSCDLLPRLPLPSPGVESPTPTPTIEPTVTPISGALRGISVFSALDQNNNPIDPDDVPTLEEVYEACLQVLSSDLSPLTLYTLSVEPDPCSLAEAAINVPPLDPFDPSDNCPVAIVPELLQIMDGLVRLEEANDNNEELYENALESLLETLEADDDCDFGTRLIREKRLHEEYIGFFGDMEAMPVISLACEPNLTALRMDNVLYSYAELELDADDFTQAIACDQFNIVNYAGALTGDQVDFFYDVTDECEVPGQASKVPLGLNLLFHIVAEGIDVETINDVNPLCIQQRPPPPEDEAELGTGDTEARDDDIEDSSIRRIILEDDRAETFENVLDALEDCRPDGVELALSTGELFPLYQIAYLLINHYDLLSDSEWETLLILPPNQCRYILAYLDTGELPDFSDGIPVPEPSAAPTLTFTPSATATPSATLTLRPTITVTSTASITPLPTSTPIPTSTSVPLESVAISTAIVATSRPVIPPPVMPPQSTSAHIFDDSSPTPTLTPTSDMGTINTQGVPSAIGVFLRYYEPDDASRLFQWQDGDGNHILQSFIADTFTSIHYPVISRDGNQIIFLATLVDGGENELWWYNLREAGLPQVLISHERMALLEDELGNVSIALSPFAVYNDRRGDILFTVETEFDEQHIVRLDEFNRSGEPEFEVVTNEQTSGYAPAFAYGHGGDFAFVGETDEGIDRIFAYIDGRIRVFINIDVIELIGFDADDPPNCFSPTFDHNPIEMSLFFVCTDPTSAENQIYHYERNGDINRYEIVMRDNAPIDMADISNLTVGPTQGWLSFDDGENIYLAEVDNESNELDVRILITGSPEEGDAVSMRWEIPNLDAND